MRWRIKLDEYNFEIKYKKHTSTRNANALYRIMSTFQIVQRNEDIFQKPILYIVFQEIKN